MGEREKIFSSREREREKEIERKRSEGSESGFVEWLLHFSIKLKFIGFELRIRLKQMMILG